MAENSSPPPGEAPAAARAAQAARAAEPAGRSRRGMPDWLWQGAFVSGCLLLMAGAVFVLGLIAVQLASLVLALIAAMLIAALFEPVLRGLQRLRVHRAVAALLCLLILLTAFVTPAVLVWNVAAAQFGDVAGRLEEGAERLRTFVANVLPITEEQLNQMFRQASGRLALGSNPLAGALTLVEILAAIVLSLFVAFFLLKDGPRMWGWFIGELPERARRPTHQVGEAMWETLTRYIRGTMAVAAIDAVGIGVALALIGVPFALPLALLVFVGGFVPYIGSTISGSIAVLVALAANGPVDALLALGAVVAVQQLEGNFLEPFIVGHQVRLHPVAVVVAVFAGSLTAGIAGAIVAVPLVAVTYRVFRVLRDRPERQDYGQLPDNV
ncbi:AI-2E family transporter [Allorhizocola rhizosphaerae]|uniref:AI-2E family transporter n=1 Tax=Allorhizocola rhizosphaerae TaxID=1872709 RepID=UPI001FE4CC9E|nr:AI-2E family transporter [Allorhizocola rhizosphaerae]